MRAGHNLQLREGVLHAGRAGAGGGGVRDFKEERAEGDSSTGLAAGGRGLSFFFFNIFETNIFFFKYIYFIFQIYLFFKYILKINIIV